ncbi:MAG: hypothetical protein HYZ54_03750 [Ignavibacteriae bacterium]|nr:hypothetical protein [Ignavibacteriota bacterium]
MKKEKRILTATHLDLHNERMSKQSLYEVAEDINSTRKPRIGIEHDMTLPPLGRINDAEVIQGEDGEYYLIGHEEYFNHQERILINGQVFIVDSFKDEEFSFSEIQKDSLERIEISVDSQNFDSYDSADNFFKEIHEETKIDFDKMGISRKSLISDPELMFRLSVNLLYGYFGLKIGNLVLAKTAEKLSDKISDDLVGLYGLLKSATIKALLYMNPKNRPITYIVEFPAEINITLIMVGKSPETFLKAMDEKTVKKLKPQIKYLVEKLDAEKIQFILNDKDKWELNYCLTKDGKSIGSEKSRKKRDVVLSNLIEKQKIKAKKQILHTKPQELKVKSDS